MTKFYPRIATDRPKINPINIQTLCLDCVEDEGLVPQYLSKRGEWLDFYYTERSGHKALVRFQTFTGLERFFTEVRTNWNATH